MKSITDEDDFIQKTIPQGAYEIENLNKEIRMIINEEEKETKPDYPFTIKPNFSTLGSFKKIHRKDRHLVLYLMMV